jgi:hypothetical protein
MYCCDQYHWQVCYSILQSCISWKWSISGYNIFNLFFNKESYYGVPEDEFCFGLYIHTFKLNTINIVTWWLKTRIVEQEQRPIARQWRSKSISAAMNKHKTIEELLEAVSSVWSVPRLYNEGQGEESGNQRLESAARSSWIQNEQWQFVVGCEESPLLAATT